MISLCRPYFDGDELRMVREVLDSGQVSQGPMVERLEWTMEEYLGVRYAVAVCNCTAALHLALMAVGVGQGDKVLVADYTFPATGHSTLYVGADPLFVDVDPDTYNIDLGNIPAKWAQVAKAVIPVHTFGQVCDMDTIMEVAGLYDLKVIEDTACAIGAKYKGKCAGTFGDVGCFSFHGRKVITCGEGGMITTNSPGIAEFCREMRDFGKSGDSFVSLGYNYKMSDVGAAILLAQFKKLDQMIRERRAVANWWDRVLSDIPEIQAPAVDEDCYHVYQSYVAKVDRGVDRDRVMEGLREEGVQSQIGTYSSCLQPIYGSVDLCPKSMDLFDRTLALPLYPNMHRYEFQRASETLRKVVEGMR